MSRMVGADPDALDRLAADFDRSAGAFESTAVRVRASVHANPWAGARATRFRNDWDLRHGPLLKRTAVALRAAAKQLRLQAQEQRRASSAGGMGPGGVVRPGGNVKDALDRLIAAARPGLDALQVLGISAGLVAKLGGWNMFQNYPANYRLVLDNMTKSPFLKHFTEPGRIPDLMRYNKSPMLQWLARSGVTDTLKPAAGFLGKIASGAGGIGAVAGVYTNFSTMIDTAAKADSPADWVTAGTYALDAASDAAMASKAGFLFGLAGKAVALPIREAAKADWSEEGRLMVVDEIVRNPNVVGEELAKATGQVAQTIGSWFIPIPAGVK